MKVTIYHQTGPARFQPFDADTAALTEAYTYEDAAMDTMRHVDLLEYVWERNNAVDGDEENVRAQARSLSVGDVVALEDDRRDPATIWAVNPIGWIGVLEADLLIALERGQQQAEEATA